MQVKKQQLEPDMEQQTGSRLGKEYVKAVYCHPAYLNYMQSTSCEMLGWINHKLESRLPGKISTMSDMHMTPPLWQKAAAAAAAKPHQSCLTLCNSTDSSPPGSSVPGILQARILECVAISFSMAES